MPLKLDRDGAQLFRQALDLEGADELLRILGDPTGPGERIYCNLQLAAWLTDSPVGSIVRKSLGPDAKAVRAIMFDKTSGLNWSLAWHQDRTIAVRERAEVAGFSHWNRKAGALHVEPPFELIERMVTARIHLDPVDESNGPLVIAPGSHLSGRIDESEIAGIAENCGSFTCLAELGDVWLYRTAILHGSSRSEGVGRRRVLQVDFAADRLPGGLEWLGVD